CIITAVANGITVSVANFSIDHRAGRMDFQLQRYNGFATSRTDRVRISSRFVVNIATNRNTFTFTNSCVVCNKISTTENGDGMIHIGASVNMFIVRTDRNVLPTTQTIYSCVGIKNSVFESDRTVVGISVTRHESIVVAAGYIDAFSRVADANPGRSIH